MSGREELHSHASVAMASKVDRSIVLSDGELFPNQENFFDGGVDEDDRDQGGEVFLCEPGDIAYEAAGVHYDKKEQDPCCPHAYPQPNGQVMEAEFSVGGVLDGEKKAVADTHWQKSYMMVSNTRTGPVLPKMVSGCPEKRP